MNKKQFICTIFAALLVFVLLQECSQPNSVPTAAEQVKRLGRGVNIIGYDPIWNDFASARFQEKHFKIIKDGGFQTVRINLHAFHHMNDSTLALEPEWLNTLDWAVDHALQQDLMVILDLHNFNEMARDPVGLKAKF